MFFANVLEYVDKILFEAWDSKAMGRWTNRGSYIEIVVVHYHGTLTTGVCQWFQSVNQYSFIKHEKTDMDAGYTNNMRWGFLVQHEQ